jgi:hypothetical protein
MTADQIPDLFKFYEEAAEKAKALAWSQTTWILTLNAGIMAVSLDFYAKNGTHPRLILIEGISAGVGVVLCLFLVYLLHELGGHIRHYWTTSNRIAASNEHLVAFISPSDAEAARVARYRAPFPAFCRRLQWLAGLFVVAHVGWLGIVVVVLT